MKLFTHNCMGDHLICYGFIKEIAKQYDEVLYTTKKNVMHWHNVKRLYSSIPNVTVTMEHFGNDYDIAISSQWWFDKLSYWYDYENEYKEFPYGEEMIFDRFWYTMANVPYYKK